MINVFGSDSVYLFFSSFNQILRLVNLTCIYIEFTTYSSCCHTNQPSDPANKETYLMSKFLYSAN